MYIPTCGTAAARCTLIRPTDNVPARPENRQSKQMFSVTVAVTDTVARFPTHSVL